MAISWANDNESANCRVCLFTKLGFDHVSPCASASTGHLARRLGPKNLEDLSNQLAMIHGTAYITYSTKRELVTIMKAKIYIFVSEATSTHADLTFVEAGPSYRPYVTCDVFASFCSPLCCIRQVSSKLQECGDYIHPEIALAVLGQEVPRKARCLLDLG